MRSLLLSCVALTACLPERPAVILDGEGCDGAVALAVLDPAVLPGWTVHTMVAERVDGDAVWTLATDPKGTTMLKPWPQGPAIDLSGLGAPEDFTLLPGREEGESWLLLGRQDGLRVWRLGAAAQGEVTASADLTGFPGPGRYVYQLLLVGDAPHLLATTTGVSVSALRFQLAPLDPERLTLGDTGTSAQFSELCEPFAEQPCALLVNDTLTDVHPLAVSEPGTMAGAAAMFGLSFTPEDSISPAFITVQAIDRGPGQAPELVARFVSLFAASNMSPQRGRLASDGDGLYVSMLVAGEDGKVEQSGFGHAYTWLADRTNHYDLLRWEYGGPLLQLGDYVILGDLVDERWRFLWVEDGAVGAAIDAPGLDLPMGTQMWSAGHEQLFMRRPDGTAMRVAGRCAGQ